MLQFTKNITFKVVHVDTENVVSYYTVAVNGIDSNFDEIDEAAEFISSQMVPWWDTNEDIITILLANIQ